LQIGVYEEGKLIRKYITPKQTSEELPLIFKNILDEFTCKRIFFARGPGSFMAIKITYVFLRTLSIAKGIKLFATDGFYFNDNKPIKAMRKMYFVKNKEEITTKIFYEEQNNPFALPNILKPENFNKEIEPLYILPAV